MGSRLKKKIRKTRGEEENANVWGVGKPGGDRLEGREDKQKQQWSDLTPASAKRGSLERMRR